MSGSRKTPSQFCSHTWLPSLTVRKDYFVTYSVWDGFHSSGSKQPKTNKANTTLSKKAIQRLRIAIELLASAAQTKRIWWKEEKRYVSFKLNFITLTLPSAQIHSDTEIVHKILKPFLRWWRDKNPSLLYVWKAECQDNGNLHFHLTTNSFIHWRTLRKKWQQCVNGLGYMDRYGKTEAPCTEVKAVKNIKDISAYISAYISKKDLYKRPLKRYHKLYNKKLIRLQEAKFDLPKNYLSNLKRQPTCKLWDAAKHLLIGPCRLTMPDSEICWSIDAVRSNGAQSVYLDFCTVTSFGKTAENFKSPLTKAYEDYIIDLRKRCKESTSILE